MITRIIIRLLGPPHGFRGRSRSKSGPRKGASLLATWQTHMPPTTSAELYFPAHNFSGPEATPEDSISKLTQGEFRSLENRRRWRRDPPMLVSRPAAESFPAKPGRLNGEPRNSPTSSVTVRNSFLALFLFLERDPPWESGEENWRQISVLRKSASSKGS